MENFSLHGRMSLRPVVSLPMRDGN